MLSLLLAAGVCVKNKGFPFTKLLKWMGIKKICAGPTTTWYPNKDTVSRPALARNKMLLMAIQLGHEIHTLVWV